MECCICLNKLNSDQNIFALSCGHELHLDCFLKLVYNNEMNIFINCPLCRKINSNSLYKTKYHDLSYIFSKYRCKCTTKNNIRCKNNARLFNYGMCYTHHRMDSYSEKHKKLLIDYILWLFETSGPYRTKYLMIDIASKICQKYAEISEIHELTHHFYHFYFQNDKQSFGVKADEMYDFLGLEKPPDNLKELIELSKKKGKLIM